ncbi:outer membrane lipoprotein carrier protein LolA [Lonepinella sp. BR2271]|uniref:outer membrane lipoprotein carrier protein LolA n=1 Tax=Lonepinella sp. BR2271 TaxID=3434550 RepID=UPI003F6DF33D
MKKTLLLFLFSLFSPLALAFSQADLVALLQKPDNIQGQFEQQRFLNALPKPIIATGEFCLVKNRGLLWQMQQPFSSQLRITPQGISQYLNGEWVTQNKLGQSEQIGLFLGLLSGNLSALQSQFDMALTGQAEHWTLTLKPSSLLMQQIFTQIVITGNDNVQHIRLDEKQGDRTEIQFNQLLQNQPLSGFAQQSLQ